MINLDIEGKMDDFLGITTSGWTAIQTIAVTVAAVLAFITSILAIRETKKERIVTYICVQMDTLYIPFLYHVSKIKKKDGSYDNIPLKKADLEINGNESHKELRELLRTKGYLGNKKFRLASILFIRYETLWNYLRERDDSNPQIEILRIACIKQLIGLENIAGSDFNKLVVETGKINAPGRIGDLNNGRLEKKLSNELNAAMGYPSLNPVCRALKRIDFMIESKMKSIIGTRRSVCYYRLKYFFRGIKRKIRKS